MRYFSILVILFFLFSCKKDKNPQISSIITGEKVYGIGLNGEKPTQVDELIKIVKKSTLTKRENKSIVIAMHDGENDWSKQVILGVKSTLKSYGFSVTLITDGEFRTEKQLSDYRQILKMKPDILITIPIDIEVMAPILHKIADNGTKIAFIDALPKGFVPKENCIGWAVGDSYTMGKNGAKMLATSLKEGAEIVLLNWTQSMFTVDRRSQGARDFFKANPKYNLVEDVSFTEFYQIDSIINKTLEKHPNVEGFWAVWDTPAFEIIKVLDKKTKIKIVCCDYSKEIKNEFMKTESNIIGTMSDNPYELGVLEALMTVATLNEIDIPGYFVTPAFAINKENYKNMWKKLFSYK